MKKMIKRKYEGTIEGCSLSSLSCYVDELILKFGGDAIYSPAGYENYGDFAVEYAELETTDEYNRRLAKTRKTAKTQRQKDLEQYEKLKKKLNITDEK